MERPSSRGGLMALSSQGLGKAPTGNAVPMPDRPSTSMRGAGPPPGTAMRGPGGGSSIIGAPPGTAMRGAAAAPPQTAYKRLGTAAGRPGTQSGGAGAAAGRAGGAPVQVENRPITNHGVSGMRVAASGGRQVL